MKTANGKYNTSKIDNVYTQLKNNLNDSELCYLGDLLVWDKHVLMKTAKLIIQDLEQIQKEI